MPARQIADIDSPLCSRTPDAWARSVLREPLALLSDHAHLEKKAAANALELLNRWPGSKTNDDDRVSTKWVRVLAAIARDEAEHLATVARILAQRGGRLVRLHRNPYANDLRGLVRAGRGDLELADRLMVSALIEARSCERFDVLARNADDPSLAKLYRGLFASEHGHYHQFLDLAALVIPKAELDQRWGELLDEESRILARQEPGPGMHSGFLHP
ncbi:MAG: tRNA-(ms[2]io[6]A)-hydroxylase [Planctomycetes bacterium]|nr:tRNA-(ms[2]io[6]A)-hydroxylase [Planctomycetota bacterium]